MHPNIRALAWWHILGQAADERTRERGAMHWATTQSDLACLVLALGQRTDDAGQVARALALALAQASLAVLTPADAPDHPVETLQYIHSATQWLGLR